MAEKTKAPKALFSEKGQQLLSWMQMNCPDGQISNKELAETLGRAARVLSLPLRARLPIHMLPSSPQSLLLLSKD